MTKPIPVQAFRLDQSGLMRLFGELEARIMSVMWNLHEATIQDVCDRLGDPNYLTVTTVMNRLVFKKVLSRHREGKVYVYTPVQTRDQFLESVSQQVMQSLLKDFGSVAVTQFAEAVDGLSENELAALEQAIARARQKGGATT
ncbi:MAG: BlaI/MecI/CopY family transcriptional regulator [Anaerolineae bacterium]|nr:BlaI/MecI/CopY family transcriptional regulator [Anaerolineae bacterium]